MTNTEKSTGQVEGSCTTRPVGRGGCTRGNCQNWKYKLEIKVEDI